MMKRMATLLEAPTSCHTGNQMGIIVMMDRTRRSCRSGCRSRDEKHNKRGRQQTDRGGARSVSGTGRVSGKLSLLSFRQRLVCHMRLLLCV